MKRTLMMVSLATAVTCATNANADNKDGFYAGGGLITIDSGATSGDGGTVGFNAGEILGGYKYSDYIGGELRVGLGLSGDNSGTKEYDINHYESIYYRMESVNQVAKAYLLFGFSNVSVGTTELAESTTATSSGVSWGVGIGFVSGPAGNLNFEYRNLIATEGEEFTSMGIGYDYRF